MNTKDFMEVLQEILILDMEDTGSSIMKVDRLETAPMDDNSGLMVRAKDGSVFQLAVIKLE